MLPLAFPFANINPLKRWQKPVRNFVGAIVHNDEVNISAGLPKL